MIESMDIIEYLENDERFGPTNILRPASGRTDLKEWQKSVRMQMRTLYVHSFYSFVLFCSVHSYIDYYKTQLTYLLLLYCITFYCIENK